MRKGNARWEIVKTERTDFVYFFITCRQLNKTSSIQTMISSSEYLKMCGFFLFK